MSPSSSGNSALAPQNVALFGPPGSGKSAVGKLLAQHLKRPFLDMDAHIEERAGKSIPAVFAEDGESAFREMEANLCRQLAGESGWVISCGGGALVDPGNRELMEASGRVIFLDCPQEVLLRRTQKADHRPLLSGDKEAQLLALLEKRREVYSSFPNRVDASGDDPERIAQAALALLDELGSATLRVEAPPPAYEVILGTGLLQRVDTLLAERGLNPPFVVVSDSNVAPLYAGSVCKGLDAELVEIPAGEEHKTLETVRTLYDRFLELGIERRAAVVALGGGVIGDMTGFAAATFMRGVRWVNLPTTLLAMVDASIGGKVGVDLPQGKNLVGAFHPPSVVVSDTAALDTLPEKELRNGMAELFKAALIADPLLFEWFERENTQPTTRWIERALAVKIDIVNIDPYERDVRAKLNLGHTVAHGLEAASEYALSHGEAVAIGLVAEARMAEALGVAQTGLAARIEAVLTRLGLPTRFRKLAVPEVRKAMSSDKKKAGGRLRFVLPVEPGRAEIRQTVPENIILQTLESVKESA